MAEDNKNGSAEKAAAEKPAKWKGKPFHELAAEHTRLRTLGFLDEADAFHREYIRTYVDKA